MQWGPDTGWAAGPGRPGEERPRPAAHLQPLCAAALSRASRDLLSAPEQDVNNPRPAVRPLRRIGSAVHWTLAFGRGAGPEAQASCLEADRPVSPRSASSLATSEAVEDKSREPIGRGAGKRSGSKLGR